MRLAWLMLLCGCVTVEESVRDSRPATSDSKPVVQAPVNELFFCTARPDESRNRIGPYFTKRACEEARSEHAAAGERVSFCGRASELDC